VTESAMYDIPLVQICLQGRRQTQFLSNRGKGWWSSRSYSRHQSYSRLRRARLVAVNDGSRQRKVIQAVTNYKIDDISVGGSNVTMMHVKANFEAVFQ
jgi:hypothetical protein